MVPGKKWSLRFVKHVQKQTTSINSQNQHKSKTFHIAVKSLFTVSIKKRPCFLKQKKLRCVKAILREEIEEVL